LEFNEVYQLLIDADYADLLGENINSGIRGET
jgi:hypothetical protein